MLSCVSEKRVGQWTRSFVIPSHDSSDSTCTSSDDEEWTPPTPGRTGDVVAELEDGARAEPAEYATGEQSIEVPIGLGDAHATNRDERQWSDIDISGLGNLTP